MRQGSIAVALFLGGALTIGLLLLMSPGVQSAPPVSSASTRGLPVSSQETLFYNRVQTVTFHAPSLSDIYTTTFTTTFQIQIMDYHLGDWLRFPTDAVTRTASCIPTSPPPPTGTCQVLWGTHVVTFAGAGRGTIHLEYDTRSRAWRDPGSRAITLAYPVGPFSPTLWFSLTNTVIFSRSADFGRQLEPAFVTPTGSVHNEEDHWLRWVFTSTPRLEFTAIFTEPLLGSDLVMDRLEMSPEHPEVGQTVHYTAVVRNQGDYVTGRAVLAELFVRPYTLGPPVVLTDHVGGWSLAGEDALFKWYSPAPYQVYLPLVTRAYQAGSSGAHASVQAGLPGSYWWPGLEPGEVITGVTSFPWPEECGARECGVWAKVDPSYMEVGAVYQWWGYNPEGLDCGLGEDGLPTCEEESNNIAAAFTRFLIYVPAVLRGQ